MSLSHGLMVVFFKGLMNLLCRIDSSQIDRVPNEGPLILYTNHVNILEVPIIYTRLQPRPVWCFVAAYRWKNPWLRHLLNMVNAIPLRRGEPDIAALRRGVEALKAGDIVVIAPEGTRSEDGQLQRAHGGIVTLALHSGAPLLPIVFYGSEDYRENLRHLRRTDFHVVAGRPFEVRTNEKATRQIRREITDEMMAQLAALLPPAYRGVYAGSKPFDFKYLVYPDGEYHEPG